MDNTTSTIIAWSLYVEAEMLCRMLSALKYSRRGCMRSARYAAARARLGVLDNKAWNRAQRRYDTYCDLANALDEVSK